jgi:hypothetical protein
LKYNWKETKSVAMLPLLQFPPEWDGTVDVEPKSFGVTRKIEHRQEKWKCTGPCGRRDLASKDSECGCLIKEHRCIVDDSKTTTEVILAAPADRQWKTLLAPYIDVAATDLGAVHVLRDCQSKINQLDSESGAGVLHGLLAAGDLSTLCELFLEIGLDPETRCILQVLYRPLTFHIFPNIA